MQVDRSTDERSGKVPGSLGETDGLVETVFAHV